MKKTLLSLMALGAGVGSFLSSGCTPEGRAFFQETGRGVAQSFAYSAADESGKNMANSNRGMPPQTNVNGYDSQQQQAKLPTYYIDRDLLDGSEKDLAEARAVYRIMVIGVSTIHRESEEGREEYFKNCPERFVSEYKEFLVLFDKWCTFNRTKNKRGIKVEDRISHEQLIIELRKIKKAAVREGVRERE